MTASPLRRILRGTARHADQGTNGVSSGQPGDHRIGFVWDVSCRQDVPKGADWAVRCRPNHRYGPVVNDLVARAGKEAARYLDSPAVAQRWVHVQAVGARAAELAAAVDPADRDLLIGAALLHDIGYAPELVMTGFHPLDGASHLERAGFPRRLVALVAHHSGARFEAAERGLLRELEAWPLEDSPVMDALVAADLTTGPRGQRFSFDERLDEILARYPAGSVVHRAMSRARPVLAVHVERVDARLSR